MLLISTALLKVATPATTTSSKSACPSTSSPAFTSTAPPNVDTPVIFAVSTERLAGTSPVPVISSFPTVVVPSTIASPRTSRTLAGSKEVVPIPVRPTTSNTFLSSVLPSIPIFCCCCLPLRKRIGAAILPT